MSRDHAPTAPDVTHSIADNITFLEGAIVVPPAKGLGNQSVQKSGVLTATGDLVENGITWRGQDQVTIRPAMPAADDIRDLPGTYMFLGPLFGHFGHFLVESICRIWAFDALRDKIDGVLTVPKFQNKPEHVAKVYRPFLDALGMTAPLQNLEYPTRVERLYVPQQGFGMFQMIEGAPEYRDFVRAHAGRTIAAQGADKIYISRSALPPGRGSVLCETLLETYLIAEGYSIFHPQKYDYMQQIAAYKAATHIVAVDCSPLHLLAMVGNAKQNVGIIARRDGDFDQYFARQITAFQGASAAPINQLHRNWIESHAKRPSRTSWGEISFTGLWHALKKAGLIGGTAPWPEPTPAQIAAEIARISDINKTPFKPYVGAPGMAPSESD